MYPIFGILLLYLSLRINNSIFILNLFFVIIFIVCCMLIFSLMFKLVTKELKNYKEPVINFYSVFKEFLRTKNSIIKHVYIVFLFQ
jgi:hypothetical protein